MAAEFQEFRPQRSPAPSAEAQASRGGVVGGTLLSPYSHEFPRADVDAKKARRRAVKADGLFRVDSSANLPATTLRRLP